MEQIPQTRHFWLAEDDDDDSLLFVEAVKELSLPVKLTVAHNGVNLMEKLHKQAKLPELLFLDLNMPLKNGFECLLEIKGTERLKKLPVIVFSTSLQPTSVNKLYRDGAHLYVRKPNDFSNLLQMIRQVSSIKWSNNPGRPPRDKFVFNYGS